MRDIDKYNISQLHNFIKVTVHGRGYSLYKYFRYPLSKLFCNVLVSNSVLKLLIVLTVCRWTRGHFDVIILDIYLDSL
jgi:hypothetical protein